jgi:hypothetical protein
MNRNIGLALLGGIGAVAIYAIEKAWKGTRRQPLAPPTPLQIDSSVIYQPPQQEEPKEAVTTATAPVVTTARPIHIPPYKQPGFGLDRSRNRDDIELESYMYPPLEGTGLTHLNRHAYEDLELEEARSMGSEKPETVQVKYIRLKVTKLRGKGQTTVHLGGIRFYNGNRVIQDDSLYLWDPYSGEKTPYAGGPWSDSDQFCAIFAFSDPIEVNRYEFRTSAESVDNDPIRWTLEGSMNGTFWTYLDDRREEDVFVPVMRGFAIGYWMKGIQEIATIPSIRDSPTTLLPS